MNTITKEIDPPIIFCITSNYWLRTLDKNNSGVDNNPGHILRKSSSNFTSQDLAWKPQRKRKRRRPRNTWRINRDTWRSFGEYYPESRPGSRSSVDYGVKGLKELRWVETCEQWCLFRKVTPNTHLSRLWNELSRLTVSWPFINMSYFLTSCNHSYTRSLLMASV